MATPRNGELVPLEARSIRLRPSLTRFVHLAAIPTSSFPRAGLASAGHLNTAELDRKEPRHV